MAHASEMARLWEVSPRRAWRRLLPFRVLTQVLAREAHFQGFRAYERTP